MPPPSRDYERGRDEPYKRLPDEAGGDDFPSDAARETAEALVAERAACRVSRDYQRADQIRDELRRAPHFVYISDKDRTWRRCSGGARTSMVVFKFSAPETQESIADPPPLSCQHEPTGSVTVFPWPAQLSELSKRIPLTPVESQAV